MDSRSIVGRHDKAVVLKAQLDNLKGRSEEMRRELKEVKLESSKSQDVIAKLSAKVSHINFFQMHLWLLLVSTVIWWHYSHGAL